jgi:hypothetical protein
LLQSGTVGGVGHRAAASVWWTSGRQAQCESRAGCRDLGALLLIRAKTLCWPKLCYGSDPRVTPVDARLYRKRYGAPVNGNPGIDHGGVCPSSLHPMPASHTVPILADGHTRRSYLLD